MLLNDRFNKIFEPIPILGMLHLAGRDPVARALKEMTIYEEEGVDGVIVENYHCFGRSQVAGTLKEISKIDSDIVVGVNILPNEYIHSFGFASQYGADFIQVDYIAGKYVGAPDVKITDYETIKEIWPKIVVLGGVWPKYYTPVAGSVLENDLREGMQLAEAVVVTGDATGSQTPLSKIKGFRRILGDHPLIIGAGLNPENAYDQLSFADGAIVGSCFKPGGNTTSLVDRILVRDFMDVVKEVRKVRG